MLMKLPKGRQAFNAHYTNYFGSDTTTILEKAQIKAIPVLLYNKLYETQLKQLWLQAQLDWETVEYYPYALKWPQQIPFGTKLPGFDQGLIYPISASSLLAVAAMQIKSTDTVLDACAAPGGKSIAIANLLETPQQLSANDLSYKRAVRMKAAFAGMGLDQITTSIRPAEKLHQNYQQIFDQILLDAPCSSEAHLLRSPQHLKYWSHKRITKLQHRQLKLIPSLLACLKPKGKLTYVTCALTPDENEVVVDQILNKFGNELSLAPKSGLPQTTNGLATYTTKERASQMYRVWSHQHNLEPMFVAIFRKN